MRLASKTTFAFAVFSTVGAIVHTECYNYFLEKDGCVWASAKDTERCDPTSGKSQLKLGGDEPEKQLMVQKRDKKFLKPRYTSENTDTSFAIHGGKGICGPYDPQEPGACLWLGSEQETGEDPSTAGWLNGANKLNCGKQVYVQRKDKPENPLFVPIVDGCVFYTASISVGCFQIALTNKTFYDLEPSPEEIDQGFVGDLVWDFDNEHGKKPQNGPN
ncbi:hypothetical protein CROQUDRAFT_61041 [Cronartium quercuum f. sp. fusiforme G11]|uniref:Secreted protein n=1 Tax=Cronartium quercuum f. sp. fusiforme G11 TaxID=708437 RepID=A0A9P6TER7_9BASI|nr:hypothetical protein CROQUDRAFT_61041 [Cronartium quercuum f. sp. fusiforme G11]